MHRERDRENDWSRQSVCIIQVLHVGFSIEIHIYIERERRWHYRGFISGLLRVMETPQYPVCHDKKKKQKKKKNKRSVLVHVPLDALYLLSIIRFIHSKVPFLELTMTKFTFTTLFTCASSYISVYVNLFNAFKKSFHRSSHSQLRIITHFLHLETISISEKKNYH